MENKKRIVLKIREAYTRILPFSRRMEIRRRLMVRLGLSKRAFETRLSNQLMIDLEEAVVWSQELNLELSDLYDISERHPPSVHEAIN